MGTVAKAMCGEKDRQCRVCGMTKPLDQFGVQRQKGRPPYRSKMCKGCNSDRTIRWAKNNPERAHQTARRSSLRSRYGLTIADYERMRDAQGGLCAVCGHAERRTARGGNQPRHLAVDHDHTTGRVRSLLCHDCNTLIGLAEDDLAILITAATYVTSHNALKG